MSEPLTKEERDAHRVFLGIDDSMDTRLLDTCDELEAKVAELTEAARWRVWMDEAPPYASDLVVVTHEDGTTWHAVGMAGTIEPTRRCLWRPLDTRRER